MCSLPSVLESPPPRNPGSLAGQTREPESPACLPELTSRWSASPVWGAQVPGTREEVSRQPAPGSLFVAPHPHHRWLHHSPLSPRVTCVWTLLGALPCEPPPPAQAWCVGVPGRASIPWTGPHAGAAAFHLREAQPLARVCSEHGLSADHGPGKCWVLSTPGVAPDRRDHSPVREDEP